MTMFRGYTSKQLKGKGGSVQGSGGLTPDKAKREQSTPNKAHGHVQGSGPSSKGTAGAKNAMSHGEGCCAKAGGHIARGK